MATNPSVASCSVALRYRNDDKAMQAGTTTSMPTVVRSMMPAISDSYSPYCCANKTDGVEVGIALATKAPEANVPTTCPPRSMPKNMAGLKAMHTSTLNITENEVSFIGYAANVSPLAKIATPDADTAKGSSPAENKGGRCQPSRTKIVPMSGAQTKGFSAERAIVRHADGLVPSFGLAASSRNTATDTCVRLVISAAMPTTPLATCLP